MSTASAATSILVGEGASLNYDVPTNGDNDALWNLPAFDDSSWSTGMLGVGFERSAAGTFNPFITSDVESAMYAVNSTIYLRIPFVAPAQAMESLTLSMRYDDGFIAYLNGVRLTGANDPVAPAFDSSATASNPDSQAIFLSDFDVSGGIASLNPGGMNILSIHGMNSISTSSDFLIDARLTGETIPEPATGALFFACLLTGALRRRR